MQTNEIIAGIASGLVMLPITIVVAFTLKWIIKQRVVAIITACAAATLILVFVPPPLIYAWRFHIVEIVIMSDGLVVFLMCHWLVAISMTGLGIWLTFKSLNSDREPRASGLRRTHRIY